MHAHQTVIDELEGAIANSDIGRRAGVLRRVTDLFVSGSGGYTSEQVALFDDVMSRLVDEIENSARALFGQRLATIPGAPPKIVRTLALDDWIEVAGPILSQSEQVDDETLVEGARTKSQAHLLAISRRRALAESVTDVLVERGDQQVAISTAGNLGAKFSDFGFSTLVERSETDDGLAVHVWLRPDIPRQSLLKLFAAATAAVRSKLEAADRRKAYLYRDLIAQAANQIQTQARECSAEFAAARSLIQSLHRSGELSEAHLSDFAHAGKFDETIVTLSTMCDLPIGLVERAIVHDQSDQLLVLAKAIGLSWDTTKAVLLVQSETKGSSRHELAQCFESFARLQPQTARRTIQFYRMREQAAKPSSN